MQADNISPANILVLKDNTNNYYFLNFMYPIDITVANNNLYVLSDFGSILIINIGSISIEK